jgi:predicted DNA-binding protein
MEYYKSLKGAEMNASYSLEPSLVEEIKEMAQLLGKKQSQIVKEAIESYFDGLRDFAISSRIDPICDLYDNETLKPLSTSDIQAIVNAKLNAAA